MTFDNYELKKRGWSLKFGLNAFIINFFLYSAIGILLDLLLNSTKFWRGLFCSRKVRFESSSDGVIEIKGLK